MKNKKFPKDVARFFNPYKSGTNAEFDINGKITRLGTHQTEISKWKNTYVKKINSRGLVEWNKL